MNTDPFQEDLKAYADGELSWLRHAAVKRHLTRCAACQKEITEMTQTASDLQRTERDNPLDSALRARILGTAFADVQGPVFNAQHARHAQDRILKACFSASLAINLLFVFWVSHSDIFQSAANLAELREKQIKVLKPAPLKHQPPKTIKHPPPPRPIKSMTPVPPKPAPRPPLKPSHHVTARPTPLRAPTPNQVQSVAVVMKQNDEAPSALVMPAAPAKSGATEVVTPGATKESASDAIITKKVEIPATAAGPTPAQTVVVKPTIPQLQLKPQEDRDEPEILGNIDDIYLPQFDSSTINVSQITANWDVDERGHTSHIRLSPQTSGNADVDSAIIDSIHKFRFKPRIHNGQPQAAHITHSFVISN